MKRDPRLIEFSREHHLALKLGNRLVKVRSVEEGNVDVDEYRDFLLAHFIEEEHDLLTIIERLDNDTVGERFLKEHAILRALLEQRSLSLAKLQEFGELLIAHTRFEERELFTLIQEYWEKAV